jgi:nicotinamide riboside kinase
MFVAGLIAVMLQDSFSADGVFFLDREFDSEEESDSFLIQQKMKMILDEFNIDYVTLNRDEQDQWQDQVSDAVQEILGKRDADRESA